MATKMNRCNALLLSATCLLGATWKVQAADIIHDAEYAILEAQNGEQWARDNKSIDAKLAEIREKNGGKPPNIIYILYDDGNPDLGLCRPVTA